MSSDEQYPSWFRPANRRMLKETRTGGVRPNVVVSKDGNGNFKSINQALAAMPKEYKGKYVIYVKAGVYNEQVLVDKKMINVFMYGDSPRKTIVTERKNFVG